jgi:hypothetical protein
MIILSALPTLVRYERKKLTQVYGAQDILAGDLVNAEELERLQSGQAAALGQKRILKLDATRSVMSDHFSCAGV